MTIKKYRCENCGYEKSFRIGSGMLDMEYGEKVKSLEKKLKRDVLNGKYGDHLKQVIETNVNKFMFYCHEGLFHCDYCYYTGVHFSQTIHLENTAGYRGEINIDMKCPQCDKNILRRGTINTCPKCRADRFFSYAIAKD